MSALSLSLCAGAFIWLAHTRGNVMSHVMDEGVSSWCRASSWYTKRSTICGLDEQRSRTILQALILFCVMKVTSLLPGRGTWMVVLLS